MSRKYIINFCTKHDVYSLYKHTNNQSTLSFYSICNNIVAINCYSITLNCIIAFFYSNEFGKYIHIYQSTFMFLFFVIHLIKMLIYSIDNKYSINILLHVIVIQLPYVCNLIADSTMQIIFISVNVQRTSQCMDCMIKYFVHIHILYSQVNLFVKYIYYIFIRLCTWKYI